MWPQAGRHTGHTDVAMTPAGPRAGAFGAKLKMTFGLGSYPKITP